MVQAVTQLWQSHDGSSLAGRSPEWNTIIRVLKGKYENYYYQKILSSDVSVLKGEGRLIIDDTETSLI